MEHPFDGVKKLLDWTKAEVVNFNTAYITFVHEYKPIMIKDFDRLTSAHILYPSNAKASPQTLNALERMAYRIIGDLRNILDQACHAASYTITGTKSVRTNFPMRASEIDFDKCIIKDNFSGIPAILHPELKSFAPFWRYNDDREGNTKLRTIGKIANPNKHQTPLCVTFGLNEFNIMNMVNVDLAINPANRKSKPDRPEIHYWLTAENYILEFQIKPQFGLKDAGVFSGIPANRAIGEMLSIVTGIVDHLESFAEKNKSPCN